MLKEISQSSLNKLKELAEKATPGPWCTCLTAEKIMGRKHPDWGCVYANVPGSKTGNILEGCQLLSVNSNLMTEEEKATARKMFFNDSIQTNPGIMGNSAEYIAAANPSVILALIEILENIKGMYDISIMEMEALDTEIESLEQENENLQTDIDRLKVELHDMDSSCAEMRKDYERKNASLEKEADWLANKLVGATEMIGHAPPAKPGA